MLSDESHTVRGGPHGVDKVPKTREGEMHFSKGQRREGGCSSLLHRTSCPRGGRDTCGLARRKLEESNQLKFSSALHSGGNAAISHDVNVILQITKC